MDIDRKSGRTAAQLIGAHNNFLLDGVNVLFVVMKYQDIDYTRNLMMHLLPPSEQAKKDQIRYFNQRIQFHSISKGIDRLRGIRNTHAIYDHDIFDPRLISHRLLEKRHELSQFTQHMNQRTKEAHYGKNNQQTSNRLAYGSLVASGWVQQWSGGCSRWGTHLRDYIAEANSPTYPGS